MCLYIYIVLPYLRHFGSFVPKIGDFGEKSGIYNTREVLKINRFPLVVFFRKKFSRAEDCAEECAKYRHNLKKMQKVFLRD